MHRIAKVDKISSIGKFRDYIAKGDVSFKEFTLIYANNGSGKTTLTSIFRSLINNDPTIIRKRISDNAILDQAVSLIVKEITGSNSTISFGKLGWKKTIDNIEIFDTFFINQNIYSGFDISDNHKKNLHQFVVGAQGVTIKNKIIKNKKDKEDKKAELDKINNNIISKVGFGLTYDLLKDFIKIKQVEATNIDTKIKKAEEILKNARAQKIIKSYSELPQVDNWTISLDLKKLETDINTSSKSIEDKALKKIFDDHIEELTENDMDGAEEWLKNGFDYVINKKIALGKTKTNELECPFCKQELPSVLNILKAYTQNFNEEFKAFIARLNSHSQKVKRINLETLIENKKNTHKIFIERTNLWAEYISTPIPSFSVLSAAKEEPFFKLFEGLRLALESKIKNPSSSISTKPIIDLINTLAGINKKIEILNNSITAYNVEIRKFKATLKDPSVAEAELNSFQRIKKRIDPTIVLFVAGNINLTKEIKQLEDDYTQLSKDEEAESNKFITTYSKRINHYLKDVFETPFQIKDMLHGSRKGRGKDAKVDYALQLNNKSISFNCDEPFSIQDCLSEGDKSTIAFSFFLSKLEVDSTLKDKILIFDDPISSLDFDRRHKTIEIIYEISKKINQTIILSHNETFIWELYKDFDAGKRKALRINQNFIADNSFIEELDIAYLVEHDYFKNMAALENWLKKPTLNDKERIIGLIRNVLESHMKFKFYRQIKHVAPNNQTFGTCIDELEKSPVNFRETDKAAIILVLRKLNSISCRSHHGGTLPDPKTYGIDISKITDTELAKYVNKTFKLIDELL